ncbi:MAG: alpha/beta hydrolase [Novosphingobium sp.]|nr:alpha/beta hydrolase [Novosphingobium sp.]
MKLLFVHGWGFDSSIWEKLACTFPDHACWERGYFGASSEPVIAEPFLAVTHSFGTMRLLLSANRFCRGIVAINGFDRFSEAEGFPGVPLRVIDRMIRRFRIQPAAVLVAFRASCGAQTSFGQPDRERLEADLLTLREGDCRRQAALSGVPILSLQGGRDAILPAAMRQAVFAGAGNCERLTLEAAGHLLPLEDAGSCQKAIIAFMERLT